MRLHRLLVGVGVLLLAGAILTPAATLEEKKFEWGIELSRQDVDDIGTDLTYSFQWSWIIGGGYHQIGAAISAFDVDFDDPFVQDQNGSAIGPIYEFNFTPKSETATGFLFATIQGLGGDTGDLFDNFTSFGVGAKVFAGNSAAVQAFFSIDSWDGANGNQDRDQTRIGVSIALYSHKR